MEAIFFLFASRSLSLETLVVLAVVIRGPQHQHVELFRVPAGTVAPWRGASLLVASLVRFLVMPMMLVMFAATVPQPSGATLSRIVSTAAAKVARLEVRRRARDRRLDRVVRIIPASWRARVAALQDEAEVVPLVVEAGQLLVEVVRQRQAERHLAKPAAGSAGGALRRGRRRDDRERRRRRQAVQLPVGLGSAATAGADLAVPVP